MRRPLAVAVVLATAGMTACSGGGSEPRLRDTATVESLLATLEDAGSFRVEGEGRSGGARGPLQGSVRADPRGSALLYPTVGDGLNLPDLEIRRDGDDYYLLRLLAPARFDTDPDQLYGTAFVRHRDDPEWLHLPGDDQLLFEAPITIDPLELLARLARGRARLDEPADEDAGGAGGAEDDEVGGDPTTRYRVDLGDAPDPEVVGRTLAAAETDLWVDAGGRLRRVLVTAPPFSLDYTLGDFGADVEIEFPAGEDVVDIDDVEVATVDPTSTAPRPDGDFEQVLAGDTGGIPWVLRRAPGTQGTTCWRFEAGDAVGSPPPAAEQPRCVFGAIEGETVAEAVRFAVRPTGRGALEALVATAPEPLAAARVLFPGGTWADATLEPALGAARWTGPRATMPTLLELTFNSGTVAACTPGWVLDAEDAVAVTDEDLVDLLGSSWTCAEAEAG